MDLDEFQAVREILSKTPVANTRDHPLTPLPFPQKVISHINGLAMSYSSLTAQLQRPEQAAEAMREKTPQQKPTQLYANRQNRIHSKASEGDENERMEEDDDG